MNHKLGKRKTRTEKFLDKHPTCCFCGGGEPACSIDHQPARALFDGREGPEDFEFPACSNCNRSSSQHENALALLIRLATKPEDGERRRLELEKYAKAMGNNFPGLLVPMTTNQKRAFLKEAGIERPANFVLSDLKMLAAGDDLAGAAIQGVMKKLFVALHYKHAGRIAPERAEVAVFSLTNAYTELPVALTEFIALLRARGVVKRSGRDLSDQFSYKFGVDMKANFSAYTVVFRNSLGAVGTVAPPST
jgi:hypothetical protein